MKKKQVETKEKAVPNLFFPRNRATCCMRRLSVRPAEDVLIPTTWCAPFFLARQKIKMSHSIILTIKINICEIIHLF